MSDIVVRVENLSKLYRLGQIVGYQTLRESLMSAMAAPFRRLRSSSHELPATSEQSSYIWALKDVSFEVKRGEAVAIIGGNGSGKSTLLKLLSRVTAPTEGYAEIHGRVGSLLEVGTGFHAELTGRENIYLNGAILGMKRGEINRRFDEIVEFSGVERFLDTPVKRYSSGMYVRLAFAVAAHLEPEILIVDEVLSVGDAEFQKKCLGRMGDVAKGGRTVLFVSHNMMAVRTLCQRAVLLNQGLIELSGNTPDVVQHYLGTQENMSGKIVWSAMQRPGNRSFKLNSVTLKNPDGSPTSSVEISRGALIEVDFEVIEKGTKVGISLIILDSSNNALIESLNNTEQEYYGKPLPCGRYISTCRLPGDFLNSGIFSISIIGGGANWTDSFRVDTVLSFLTIDDGVLRGDYRGGYAGSLRPRLEWSTRIYDNTTGNG